MVYYQPWQPESRLRPNIVTGDVLHAFPRIAERVNETVLIWADSKGLVHDCVEAVAQPRARERVVEDQRLEPEDPPVVCQWLVLQKDFVHTLSTHGCESRLLWWWLGFVAELLDHACVERQLEHSGIWDRAQEPTGEFVGRGQIHDDIGPSNGAVKSRSGPCSHFCEGSGFESEYGSMFGTSVLRILCPLNTPCVGNEWGSGSGLDL